MEFKENLQIHLARTIRGIYFLMNDTSDVVYVGKSSTNIISRICTHIKDGKKNFSKYAYLEFDGYSEQQLIEKESDYIVKYKPLYNSVIAKSEKWRPISEVMKTYSIPRREVFEKLPCELLAKGVVYVDISNLSGYQESCKAVREYEARRLETGTTPVYYNMAIEGRGAIAERNIKSLKKDINPK